jgi:hypothetical protein
MIPVSKKIRRSAKRARHQLDQVLLNLSHSSLQKMTQSFKHPAPDDLIGRLGQSVLARAGQMRAQLEQLESMAREPQAQIRKITRKPRQAIKKAKATSRLTQRKIKNAFAKNTARGKSKEKAAARA